MFLFRKTQTKKGKKNYKDKLIETFFQLFISYSVYRLNMVDFQYIDTDISVYNVRHVRPMSS